MKIHEGTRRYTKKKSGFIKGGTMLKRILNQKKYFKNIYKEQKGITGLETAIILIAFVVVAAVFAYTVLSAGLFSTQKAQEAVYSGLKSTESTMAIKGDIIATASATGAAGHITTLTFTVANVAGGESVDLTTTAGGKNVTVISYVDSTQKIQDLSWTKAFIGSNDGDDLLDPGEKCQITVTLGITSLGINQTFSLEIKSANGAVLTVERTTPATFELVNDLH
jgi:archaeal flagellin FlaB